MFCCYVLQVVGSLDSGAFYVQFNGCMCKSRNCFRYSRDPLDAGAESMVTFRLLLNMVGKHRPCYFLMENVPGCKPLGLLILKHYD